MKKMEDGEYYITRRFIICPLYQIPLIMGNFLLGQSPVTGSCDYDNEF
jgi:hypothetical protein